MEALKKGWFGAYEVASDDRLSPVHAGSPEIVIQFNPIKLQSNKIDLIPRGEAWLLIQKVSPI